MMTGILAWDYPSNTAIQPEREPVDGEWAKYPNGIQKQYNEPTTSTETVKPIVPLSNLVLALPAQLVGNIYWLEQGVSANVTADLALPDGQYMIMAEQIVYTKTSVEVQGDVRFIATILNGIFTMTVKFPETGNYLLTAKE